MTPEVIVDVRERVRRFIAETFYVRHPSEIGDDASLVASGLVDSTGVLELVAFLESEFEVVVAQDDITSDNFETIERIAALVAAKK